MRPIIFILGLILSSFELLFSFSVYELLVRKGVINPKNNLEIFYDKF